MRLYSAKGTYAGCFEIVWHIETRTFATTTLIKTRLSRLTLRASHPRRLALLPCLEWEGCTIATSDEKPPNRDSDCSTSTSE